MPPKLTIAATVLGAPDAGALASFYQQLLGWGVKVEEPNWVMLKPPGGGTGLSFQTETDYVRPVWPNGPGDQQMMVHLDISADDPAAAVSWALDAGAVLAEYQPQEDVRVMLDPAGHPFCLF